MKKKEIKEMLSRFDEIEMPDGQKIISSCGAEYRCVSREKNNIRRRRIAPAFAVATIILLIASIITVAANSEGAREFWRYVERTIRVFYADGSYSDEVIGGYMPVGTGGTQIHLQTSAQTQRPPSGVVQNPDYWNEHKKDVSGYTAELKYIQAESGRIIVHINGGEDFRVYKNYVKLERRIKGLSGAVWENVYERLLPVYELESGNTLAYTTDIYEDEGDFAVNIEGLEKLLIVYKDGYMPYEYCITVKVCSPSGEYDEGDIAVKFEPSKNN